MLLKYDHTIDAFVAATPADADVVVLRSAVALTVAVIVDVVGDDLDLPMAELYSQLAEWSGFDVFAVAADENLRELLYFY